MRTPTWSRCCTRGTVTVCRSVRCRSRSTWRRAATSTPNWCCAGCARRATVRASTSRACVSGRPHTIRAEDYECRGPGTHRRPTSKARLVTREQRAGERDGAPTCIAVARREHPADAAELWNALTDPERIPRWFLPVTGELRPGGRYRFEGNASGTVLNCEAPHSFAITWEMMGSPSWVTVTLTPVSHGTELELVHEAHVPEEFWSLYGPGAVGIG